MEATFTAKQVAGILELSRKAVGVLLKSGELEGKKNGRGHWEISQSSIDDFQEKTEEDKTDLVEASGPSKFVENDNIPGY